MRALVPDDSNAIEMIEGFGLCLEKLGDAALWHGEDADAAKRYLVQIDRENMLCQWEFLNALAVERRRIRFEANGSGDSLWPPG
jgi:hypothetical protein